MGFFQREIVINKTAMSICVQSLCEHKFLFLWDKCLGLQLLGYMVAAYLVFKINAKEFTSVIVLFYIAMSNKRVTQFPCILTSIRCCHHFCLSILLGV